MRKRRGPIAAARVSGTPTPGMAHSFRVPPSVAAWGTQLQRLKAAGIFTLQIAGLWLIYRLSAWIVARCHLPVPGNVLGMLILFALLTTGVVKLEWIAGAADLLTKHLAFFFIPVAVGLMQWGDLLWRTDHWLLLALTRRSVRMHEFRGLAPWEGGGSVCEPGVRCSARRAAPRRPDRTRQNLRSLAGTQPVV